MTHHRGFSFVQAFGDPCFRPALSNLPFGRSASWARWSVAVYSSFATHSLADFFTVYGTQIFWP